VLKGHTSTVRGLAFSADGKTLASGGFDETLRLWDVAGRKPGAVFRGANDYAISFAPDGKTIATGGANLTLWDAATGKVLAAAGEKSASSVHCVAFGPGGTNLASARFDGNVALWGVNPLRRVALLEGRQDAVYSLAFSPDGKMLASGGSDKTVKLWDIESGREAATLSGRHEKAVCFVRFSENGRALVSASLDGIVERWDVAAGQRIGR
jgi:WD40 repeat protein